MNGKTILWICGLLSIASAQDAMFMQSRQNFALDLFKNAREQVNVVISPISMDYALNVLFLGATKTTLTTLKTGLEYPKKYSVNMIAKNLEQWTETVGEIPGVEMVTKLYVNKTVQTMKNYTSLIKKSLNATSESIVFVKSKQAATKINDWIAKATHNLILNLIPSYALNNGTKVLIVNCIYFKANWHIPFRKSSTFRGSFNAIDGKKVPVNYMTRTGFYDYNENSQELNGAAVVSIDYKKSNSSMLFILPPTDTDVESWVGGIKNVDWSGVIGTLNTTYLNVTIPKFNITYLRDMSKTLKTMKMGGIFDNNASFDKMFMPKDRPRSNICTVFQKAVISVDEDGTIAAAVTVMMMGSGSPSTPPIFMANRPFFFVIRDGSTVLFMGQHFGIQKVEVNVT